MARRATNWFLKNRTGGTERANTLWQGNQLTENCLVPLAGKYVAPHTIKGEGVGGGLAPLVPNFGTRLRQTANFTPGVILPLRIG